MGMFHSFETFLKTVRTIENVRSDKREAVLAEWNTRTKPPGSLGRLEEIAAWVASAQWNKKGPVVRNMRVNLFAASHGITRESVSMCPDHINGQMFQNFQHGGAAINTLCRSNGIDFAAFDAGIDRPTQNMLNSPAMSETETLESLELGWNSVDDAIDLFAVGEMGIGNTTPSAAIIAVATGRHVAEITGRGAGLTDELYERKKRTLIRILENRKADCVTPLQTLAAIGGREIAAMTGAILKATFLGIPVVLDGVIAGAAAAIAFELNPNCKGYCIAGHRSEEPAHTAFLEHYHLHPILDLGMRLGEGTGAAVAMGIIRNAVDAFNHMATFESAGVVL